MENITAQLPHHGYDTRPGASPGCWLMLKKLKKSEINVHSYYIIGNIVTFAFD